MALSASDRKRRQRDKDRRNRDIVRGAEQASREKHESVTQRAERVARALAYQEWLTGSRPQLDPNASESERRAFYGYTVSEQRPESERAEAAQRMVEKSQRTMSELASVELGDDPHPRESGTIDV